MASHSQSAKDDHSARGASESNVPSAVEGHSGHRGTLNGAELQEIPSAELENAEHAVDQPWFVYILLCIDGSYYVGFTQDLPDRVEIHSAGRGPAYTASRRPVKLVYSEPHQSAATARRREIQIKKWSAAKKTALISGDLENLHRLAKSHQKP